ncbi:hypothetical protein CEQ28_005575 [Hafnia alvei]|uniref:Uncharacterized protein n=1 Tax=Hafnia alvei TaxID=569 RepID=A0ABD7Q5L3_HAFAL|nr:hypothetical protein CEQ28_005575 [Hafnia alvei]TBL68077.1 hypothetical protein EYY96_08660 [Hafnia alvei]
MPVRIRLQGCRRKNGGARMAIAVRSVKTGMMKRGNPHSGLVGGAKPGCKAAAIEPPCSDAGTQLRRH